MRAQRFWYAVVVTLSLILYLVTDKRPSVLLLLGFTLLPVLTFVIQLLAGRGLTLTYEAPESCEVGQEVFLDITLRRRSRLPIGTVRAEFLVENILYGEENVKTVLLQPMESRELRYRLPFAPEDCGFLRITSESVSCTGFLGLWALKRPGGGQRQLLVYPKPLHLSLRLERRPQTYSAAELYDPYRKGQDVSEVADLRPYVAGDAPGSIHWKLSSKLDELIVREFGYPSDYSTLLLYSLAGYKSGGNVTKRQLDAVLSLMSSVSRSLLSMSLEHSVGHLECGVLTTLPVYSVETHSQMTIAALSSPAPGQRDGGVIDGLLRDSLRNRYTKIIYIAAEYDEGAARQLSQSVDLTVIQVLEGAAEGLPEGLSYAVIPVNAEDYQEKVHSIVL